ncbi:unnamed protein product, partial [marine sediment metagenome]
MWASKLAHTLGKIVNSLSWWAVIIGMVALVLMMVTVVIDVTLRTLSKGVLGSVDIVGLLLVVVFFCGYAYAETKGRHIQVDVLVARLSPTAQQIITTSGYFITIGVTILISWQCFVYAVFLKTGGIHTGVLHIPLWPFLAAAGFFVVLFTVALLSTFLTHIAELLRTIGTKAYWWLLPGVILASG